MAKYYLCFECENEFGKKEVYPLLHTSLENIDMYTAFCKDAKDLLDKLPNGKQVGDNPNTAFYLPNVKEFISEHFKLESNDYEFYIREDSGINVRNGRIKIPVLYSNDRDVVYINKGTDEDEILNKLLDLQMSIAQCNNARVRTLEGIEHKKNKIKYNFFSELISKLERRNNRLIGMFEKSSSDFIENRTYLLATNTNNLVTLSKEAKRNPMLRRVLTLDIKSVLKVLDDLTGEKTRLISKEESYDRQKRREEISKFSISKIMRNIDNCLSEEQAYYNKKYDLKSENEEFKYGSRNEEDPDNKEITAEEILKYNKERYKGNNNVTTNAILNLIERLTNERIVLDNLLLEEQKYEDVINHGNYTIKREVAEANLENIVKTKKTLLQKISELEYTIEQLESGQCVYSDAGFIVYKR